jgi:hypothetical protein
MVVLYGPKCACFFIKIVMGEMSVSTCCRRVSSDKIEKMVLALKHKNLKRLFEFAYLNRVIVNANKL